MDYSDTEDCADCIICGDPIDYCLGHGDDELEFVNDELEVIETEFGPVLAN